MSKYIRLIDSYEKAHAKRIATGHRRECPYCGGGAGMTEKRRKINKRKKLKPKKIKALCFTCWAMYGRRILKSGKIANARKLLDK